MDLQLKNKCFVLTGASGFLGGYIKEELEKEGAEVIGVDKVEAPGISGLDITNARDVSDFFNNQNRYFDGIINNAAVSYKGYTLTEKQFDDTFDVNVKGTYNMLTGIVQYLNDNSSIVNISSIYGVISPNPSLYDLTPELYNSSAYGASKSAVQQLTKYYAVHLGPDIRVNSISPGGILQNQSDAFISTYSNKVPLGRMADPQEIVWPILFLLSNRSSYITGINLNVSGGMEIL